MRTQFLIELLRNCLLAHWKSVSFAAPPPVELQQPPYFDGVQPVSITFRPKVSHFRGPPTNVNYIWPATFFYEGFISAKRTETSCI